MDGLCTKRPFIYHDNGRCVSLVIEVIFAIMFYSIGYQYGPHSSVPQNFNNDEQVSECSASSFTYESGDNVVLCCLSVYALQEQIENGLSMLQMLQEKKQRLLYNLQSNPHQRYTSILSIVRCVSVN